MFKKSLAIVLSAAMLLGNGMAAFAADTEVISQEEVKDTIIVEELVDHLNSIDFGKDITFTVLPQSKLNDQELLRFDSIEDAEAYLREFISKSSNIAMPSEMAVQNSIMQQIDTDKLAKSGAGWYNGTVWWWGGGNTSLLSLTNAEVKFYYNGSGKMSNISVKNSYMTGIVGATWTHRRGSATALGGMDAKYSVTGTWFIGLDIFGYPVGASFDETLKSPTITMDIN